MASAIEIRAKFDNLVAGNLAVGDFSNDDIHEIQSHLGEDELRLFRALQGSSISAGVALGGAGTDAFGRQRVSNPTALFASKQPWDAQALLWDDVQVSGGGTTTTHDPDRASSTLLVAAATAGLRVRQTFQRWNYQSGKSQQIFITGVLQKSGGGTDIRRRMGLFDESNGIFLEDDEGTISLVVRSFITGAAVDTNSAVRSAWYDPLDGTGNSGVNLDFTKSQILVIDFEWLGVGTVRIGFVVNGQFVLAHAFHNANITDGVYMSTPNLPVRYEIENLGTGAESELETICSQVSSEGGDDLLGVDRYFSNANTLINANTAGTIYALIGIRLKSTHIGAAVRTLQLSTMATTTTDYEWLLILNPTVAAAITWTPLANSALEVGPGNAGNPSTSTLTNGTILDGGYVKNGGGSGATASSALDSALSLGSTVAGVSDALYLAARPIDANADVVAGLKWRELS